MHCRRKFHYAEDAPRIFTYSGTPSIALSTWYYRPGSPAYSRVNGTGHHADTELFAPYTMKLNYRAGRVR